MPTKPITGRVYAAKPGGNVVSRTIAGVTYLLLIAAIAPPAMAANPQYLATLSPRNAVASLCDDAELADDPEALEAIRRSAEELFAPIRDQVQEARRVNARAKGQMAFILKQAREAVMKRKRVDDESMRAFEVEIYNTKQAVQRYEALAPSERTNWVSDPNEVLHDQIVEIEARKRTRATIEAMSDDAIRYSDDFDAFSQYYVELMHFNRTEKVIEELGPTFDRWKEAVPRLDDCIERRKAALEEEAKGLAAATAKGSINGNCTGKISLFGETTQSSWPLEASIQLDRNPEGDVQFSLVTKERGQKLTLNGKYGSNFSASGGAGSIRMSVKGSLSEHPEQPELLQGSGTGQSTDSSEMQVKCQFAWKTNP